MANPMPWRRPLSQVPWSDALDDGDPLSTSIRLAGSPKAPVAEPVMDSPADRNTIVSSVPGASIRTISALSLRVRIVTGHEMLAVVGGRFGSMNPLGRQEEVPPDDPSNTSR